MGIEQDINRRQEIQHRRCSDGLTGSSLEDGRIWCEEIRSWCPISFPRGANEKMSGDRVIERQVDGLAGAKPTLMAMVGQSLVLTEHDLTCQKLGQASRCHRGMQVSGLGG